MTTKTPKPEELTDAELEQVAGGGKNILTTNENVTEVKKSGAKGNENNVYMKIEMEG